MRRRIVSAPEVFSMRAFTTVTAMTVTFGALLVCLNPSVASAADTTPPTVTVSDQGDGSTAPFTVDFSEPVAIPDHSLVQFVESEDAVLLPGALACTSGLTVEGLCQTWSFAPSQSTLLADTYDVYFQASPGSFADSAGNEMAQTSLSVRGTTRLGPSDPALSYRWSTVAINGTVGESVTREREKGANFTYSFKGKNLTWYTMRGPTQGVADVKITRPGRRALSLTVDNERAKVSKQVPIRFTKLGAGTHTLTITAASRSRNPEANDNFVTLDALKVGKKTRDNPDGRYRWDSYDGTRRTYQPNAQVSFQFRGAEVNFSTEFGIRSGQVEVFVDGGSWGVVDLYSDFSRYEPFAINGLEDGKHTVTIVTLPDKNPNSAGHTFAVRAVSVL